MKRIAIRLRDYETAEAARQAIEDLQARGWAIVEVSTEGRSSGPQAITVLELPPRPPPSDAFLWWDD